MSIHFSKIDTENIKLVWEFTVNSTNCNNPDHYNNYIKYSALNDMKDGLGVTYFYIDTDENDENETLAGYITLRMSSLIKDAGDEKKYGFPALEIAELAVSERYSGCGLGKGMVLNAINIAEELNEKSSIKYIVLCSDPTAVGFYEKLEFQKIREVYEEIPREHANIDCVPMYIKLR